MRTRKLSLDWRDIFANCLLLAGFISMKLYLSHRGMEFITTPLEHFYQVLDPKWLRTDLLSSIIYLHSQPPLFNLFLGLVLMKTGVYAPQVFNFLYQLLALGIILMMYAIQRILKINPWLAFFLCIIWMIYPAFIYFQNFLFYPIPVQFLLLLASLLLSLAFSKSIRYLFAFFISLVLLLTLRSTYNIVYTFAVLVLLILLNRPLRKIILLSFIPTSMIVLVFTAKNIILFNQISPSSWLGMNLANVTVSALTQDEKEYLVEQGQLPRVVLSGPFNPITTYPENTWQYIADQCRGPDSLCQSQKSNNEPNYNFIGYIPISNDFLKADLYIIQHYPIRFLRQVIEGWRFYTSPSHITHYVNERSFRPIKQWALFTDRILCNGITDVYESDPCYPIQFTYSLIIISSGIIWMVRKQGDNLSLSETNTLVFILFTLVYSAVIGSILDLGENNRFRLETDPLFMILLGYILSIIGRAILGIFYKSPTTP